MPYRHSVLPPRLRLGRPPPDVALAAPNVTPPAAAAAAPTAAAAMAASVGGGGDRVTSLAILAGLLPLTVSNGGELALDCKAIVCAPE